MSDIRNKIKRTEVFYKEKAAKNQEKLKRRIQQKKAEKENPDLRAERLERNVPKTLENTRETDETFVGDDEEILEAEEVDEFSSYFRGLPPKILVTTSRRASPSTFQFTEELCSIFPSAQYVKRGSQFEVKKIVELATKREYTDIIIVNDDKKAPNAITIIHLPDGPTAHFKLSSVKLNRDIKGHGRLGPEKPELILNNFNTRLGHTIGRMFASLFPHVPEFKGRQVATLHNQRDFIFFRRHRYIFRDGKRCDLQEIGPRFTLKLRWLQKGTFDTKAGEYEWMFKPEMETSRKRTTKMTGKKLVLAYSGGLDTSCILAWLLDEGYEVIAYMADIGQEEDFEAAREKALKIGASKVFIEDLRKEFVDGVVFSAVQANALYEGVYLLGTSLARPIICKKQVRGDQLFRCMLTCIEIEIAQAEGCNYVAHGCTGKGNDQVRFELGYLALEPSIQVVAPWRIPEFYERFPGRSALLEYAAQKNIPVFQTAAKPWSTDENLFHISYEAGILEDPSVTPPKDMWKLIVDPEDAPSTPERIVSGSPICNSVINVGSQEIVFKEGKPISVTNTSDGTKVTDSLDLFLYLNQMGRKHGIGRIDIVENRFIGIKSRGCYETPGGTILRAAHVDLEGLTLDREVRRLRDQFSQRLAEIIYNGFWFSPEREFIMSSVEWSQKAVSGSVQLKLYKGNVIVEGRRSDMSLYDEKIASMDVAGGFNPSDSTGFININAIRLKAYVQQKKKIDGSVF
ncbi:argininosuccinate synthetase [Irineochytrium annulatum]|nr:argininosuccinate synthetase [Irineochytrium annulatum]